MYNACYGGQACIKEGDGSGSLTTSDVVATDSLRSRFPYHPYTIQVHRCIYSILMYFIDELGFGVNV